MRQQKLPIYTFPILSHSNQSTYPARTQNAIHVEANVRSMYAKFQLHPSYGFRKEDF